MAVSGDGHLAFFGFPWSLCDCLRLTMIEWQVRLICMIQVWVDRPKEATYCTTCCCLRDFVSSEQFPFLSEQMHGVLSHQPFFCLVAACGTSSEVCYMRGTFVTSGKHLTVLACWSNDVQTLLVLFGFHGFIHRHRLHSPIVSRNCYRKNID